MADQTPEMRRSILKWAFAWMVIMLSVNSFYAGYLITERSDLSTLTSAQMYSLFFQTQGTMQTNLNSINETVSGYSQEDINANEGGFLTYILDALDTIFNYAKFVLFAVQFVAFGGLFLAWDVLTDGIIQDAWVKLIISGFMTIGNVIFIVLIYRFVLNKGKED